MEVVVVVQFLVTTAYRLSFWGGQLNRKVGVVVVFPIFLFTTTTASKLGRGLSRCFRGCVVVVFRCGTQDDNCRLGRGIKAFGLTLEG